MGKLLAVLVGLGLCMWVMLFYSIVRVVHHAGEAPQIASAPDRTGSPQNRRAALFIAKP